MQLPSTTSFLFLVLYFRKIRDVFGGWGSFVCLLLFIRLFESSKRLPMHLSVIISIVKYLYRFENASDGLLKDSYISSNYKSHESL